MKRHQIAAIRNMPGAYVDSAPINTAGDWSVLLAVPVFTFDTATGELVTDRQTKWFSDYGKCIAALYGE